MLQSTYCKEPHLMHLVRILIFLQPIIISWFSASHIVGKLNTGADALSRNNRSLFLSQVPKAAQNPAFIPPQLISLQTQNITWTCTAWMELFNTTLYQQSSHKTYQAAANKYLGFSTYPPSQLQKLHCAIFPPVWLNKV